MAVNVTQKDKTLYKIIEHCENQMSMHRQFSYPVNTRTSVFHAGWYRAYDEIVQYCRELLGYSGNMPLETPNQSEGANQ